MCIDLTNFKMRYLIRELNFESSFVLRMLRKGGERGEMTKLLISVVLRCLHGLFIKCYSKIYWRADTFGTICRTQELSETVP